jgi:hypothetical protein
MGTISEISEHLDSHDVVTFTIPAGVVESETAWMHEQHHYYRALIVREILAVVASGGSASDVAGPYRTAVRDGIADAADVAQVLDNSRVVLQGYDKVIFERPLDVIVATVKNRDAETEERLRRLERMMNVLVEQDSTAGEALRRLGGAKIDYESPTRLAIPALFPERTSYVIRLCVQARLELKNDVVVRISVLGIKKQAVS